MPAFNEFWIVLSKLQDDEVLNILLQEVLGGPTLIIDELLSLPSKTTGYKAGQRHINFASGLHSVHSRCGR